MVDFTLENSNGRTHKLLAEVFVEPKRFLLEILVIRIYNPHNPAKTKLIHPTDHIYDLANEAAFDAIFG